MMKKITLLTLFTIISAFGYSQVDVQDFEGSDLSFDATGGGILSSVVENPDKTGSNTSDNCLQVSTNGSANWWGYTTIPVNPVASISAADLKFLSIMINYPASGDLAVRFDADDDDANGVKEVRALNAYDASNPNTWQQIIFEIKDDDDDAFAFTLGTIDRLIFHPDMGFENEPAGRVLSDVVFGYIDNVQILDENPLATASVNDANLQDAFTIYPSAVSSTFTVKTTKTISDISVFSILGKNVSNNIVKLGNETYDASSLASGMYIVKIASENGNFITKKIIKE